MTRFVTHFAIEILKIFYILSNAVSVHRHFLAFRAKLVKDMDFERGELTIREGKGQAWYLMSDCAGLEFSSSTQNGLSGA